MFLQPNNMGQTSNNAAAQEIARQLVEHTQNRAGQGKIR